MTYIKDTNGNRVGYCANGEIYKGWSRVGQYFYGEVTNLCGARIGKYSAGEVTDTCGTRLGRYDSRDIMRLDGTRIGTIEGYDDVGAAAAALLLHLV